MPSDGTLVPATFDELS